MAQHHGGKPNPAFKERPCKKCGRLILIAVNADTLAMVAMDFTAPVYRAIMSDLGDGKGMVLTAVLADFAFVSHFQTCTATKDLGL